MINSYYEIVRKGLLKRALLLAELSPDEIRDRAEVVGFEADGVIDAIEFLKTHGTDGEKLPSSAVTATDGPDHCSATHIHEALGYEGYLADRRDFSFGALITFQWSHFLDEDAYFAFVEHTLNPGKWFVTWHSCEGEKPLCPPVVVQSGPEAIEAIEDMMRREDDAHFGSMSAEAALELKQCFVANAYKTLRRVMHCDYNTSVGPRSERNRYKSIERLQQAGRQKQAARAQSELVDDQEEYRRKSLVKVILAIRKGNYDSFLDHETAHITLGKGTKGLLRRAVEVRLAHCQAIDGE